MPLIEALLTAGHKLQLVMRPPAADLARELFPEVEMLILEHDPFRAETKMTRRPFHRELDAILRFNPDMYVASAFQLSFFDEIFIKERASDLRVAGFEAEEDFWPSDTSVDPRDLARHFSTTVRVPSAMAEGEKNRRMASAVLGAESKPMTRPRGPTDTSLSAARTLLAEHGLEKEKFVVVCAGSRPGLVMKDWGEGNWVALLKRMTVDDGRAFVFLGNPKESASIERLCAAMPSGLRHVNLAPDPPPVSVSYALVSMAGAYLGRDSGVMHMAAALDVPILAVFSGGHWPRFLPEASRGIILTRQAPCRGCNFYCPLVEPWCVTSISVDDVYSAWVDLAAVNSLEIRELPAPPEWMAEMRGIDADRYRREILNRVRQKTLVARQNNLMQRIRQIFASSR